MSYNEIKRISSIRFLMLKLLIVIRRNIMQAHQYKFYDIAANLTDDQFAGKYYDKQSHHDDRKEVIQRAKQYGCQHLLIAAGNLEDAHKSYQLCSTYQNCYATIGVHPCRAKEPFNKHKWQSVEKYFQRIDELIPKYINHLVAIGQCGLDYDRLEWSTKQEQLQVFPYHFELAEKYKLPMYLHNRNTGNDFYDIVAKNRDRFSTGVVHSFTGTKQELDQILQLDLYVGINGCSLKTQQNLAVLKHIPIERLMLQTDSPYCQMRKSHKSYDLIETKFESKPKQKKKEGQLVKGRNEPCKIIQVYQVVSKILEIDREQLWKTVLQTSLKILGPRQAQQAN